MTFSLFAYFPLLHTYLQLLSMEPELGPDNRVIQGLSTEARTLAQCLSNTAALPARLCPTAPSAA